MYEAIRGSFKDGITGKPGAPPVRRQSNWRPL